MGLGHADRLPTESVRSIPNLSLLPSDSIARSGTTSLADQPPGNVCTSTSGTNGAVIAVRILLTYLVPPPFAQRLGIA